jgi:hypothetical protein
MINGDDHLYTAGNGERITPQCVNPHRFFEQHDL